MQVKNPVSDAVSARARKRRSLGAATSYPLLTGLRAFDSFDDEENRVSTGDLLSIVGASHTGKTQLLYALLAAAVAPSPAGRASQVVYFELLEQVNVSRIAALIRDRIECSSRAMGMNIVEREILDEHISNSLSRIHVYRVNSTEQLCVTLYSIERLLSTRGGTEIDMICIDGLGAMHYADKFESDPDANEGVIVHIIRRVLKTYRNQLFVAVTECALYDDVRIVAAVTAAKDEGRAEHEVPFRPASTMPRDWSDVITHTVTLYFASDEVPRKRGALVLLSRNNWKPPSLITAGELLVDEKVVALRQQAVLSASASSSASASAPATMTERL